MRSLRDFRVKTQRAATDRDNEVARATRSLESITSGRLLRADRARLEDSIAEITQEASNVRQRIAQGMSDALNRPQHKANG